ncbi:RNA-metabolising metallo-beta-lactamase [Candidatus Sulfobium mesophilum]|uniref:RNA-metabolising metallo-beta-lactamase n=1 Tax=Candidatus Sulfobium mesophilum TaxID=2016548 RepID=A0A2U3QJ57_9BACT|nr:RNA-metabolising metallo-beta-lactamase [Candidatus Sulfobium mesophilum]
MKIRFLGGARTVTGSCFQVMSEKANILIDCGMYQGRDAEEVNKKKFDFAPAEIDCLFLTHSHLDHVGLVPKLVRDGFKGKIITTAPTADIAELIMYDSAHIQESDTEWYNRKALRLGMELKEPLYLSRDVDKVLPLITRRRYGNVEELNENVRYRFVNAGHILGSSTLELWCRDSGGERKMVFSGDIGKKDNPIVDDPVFVEETDYLTIESTYGNRNHKGMQESIDELVDVIKSTFRAGGNVIIPSFALGRTQDLLFILNKLVKEDRLFRINVYIDSPLGEGITRVYEAHKEYFDEEAKRLFSTESRDAIRIHFTRKMEDSVVLNTIKKEAIIIASSGMCEGGRVRHHLKHNLWRKECSIVFVGFQAKGTLGRQIVDGAKVVDVLGENIVVRAQIHTLGGFSAHADQSELIDWISRFKNSPEIFIVHGEEKASLDFQEVIKQKFKYKTNVPARGEEFEI